MTQESLPLTDLTLRRQKRTPQVSRPGGHYFPEGEYKAGTTFPRQPRGPQAASAQAICPAGITFPQQYHGPVAATLYSPDTRRDLTSLPSLIARPSLLYKGLIPGRGNLSPPVSWPRDRYCLRGLCRAGTNFPHQSRGPGVAIF